MRVNEEAPPSYGPGIHTLLTVAHAQQADASATLLSHRTRAVVLLAVAVLGIVVSPKHWPPVSVSLLVAGLFAAVAAFPRSVDSGVKADAIYQECGAHDPEALAAQLVSNLTASIDAQQRMVHFASEACRWAILFLLVASLLAIVH